MTEITYDEHILLKGNVCPKTEETSKSCNYIGKMATVLNESLGEASTEVIIRTGFKVCKNNDKCVAREAYETFAKATQSDKVAKKITGADKLDLPNECIYGNVSMWETYADQAENDVDGLFV